MTSDATFPDLPVGHLTASEALALLRARAGATGEQTVPDQADQHPAPESRWASETAPVAQSDASRTSGAGRTTNDDGSSTSAVDASGGPTSAPDIHPRTGARSAPEAPQAPLARDLAPERWDAVRAATHDGRITASAALRLLYPSRP